MVDVEKILKKMVVKSGMQLLLVNAPPGWTEYFQQHAPGNSIVTSVGSEVPAVLLFAASQAELKAHAAAVLGALGYDGLLWAAYPKRSSGIKSDLYRDAGWEPFTEAGLRPVTQISLDETWSALRFRPQAAVGR